MEWKLILQTGGKGISREGQEFGGGAQFFGSVPSVFLRFTAFSPDRHHLGSRAH